MNANSSNDLQHATDAVGTQTGTRPEQNCALASPPVQAPPKPPAKRRGGGQPGNRNRLRHGLTCGSDPAPYITRLTAQFREQVEQAVVAACGTITVAQASEIQAAAEWENHRIKVRRWLRDAVKAGVELSIEQKLSLSREAARAATERTKHLKALCIGSPVNRSVWATLDAVARDADARSGIESDGQPAASNGHVANGEARP